MPLNVQSSFSDPRVWKKDQQNVIWVYPSPTKSGLSRDPLETVLQHIVFLTWAGIQSGRS